MPNTTVIINLCDRSVRFLLNTCKKHKKKLISLCVIAILYQLVKRNMKMGHILMIVEKCFSVFKMLPLPELDSYREMPNYQHPPSKPLKQILELINIDNLRMQIKNKQATWDHLKLSVLNGVIVSLVVYDIQKLYYQVHNKYRLDFAGLGADGEWEEYIAQAKKSFSNDLPLIFQWSAEILEEDISKVELKATLSLAQIEQLLLKLIHKIYEKKYILNPILRSTFDNDHKYRIASQYFRSALEVPENHITMHSQNSGVRSTEMTQMFPIKKESSSIVGLKKVGKFIGSLISKISIFPKKQSEVTGQRFQCHQQLYALNFKKIPSLIWPTKQSEYLHQMVEEETLNMIESLNFNIVTFTNAMVNHKVMVNRFRLLFKTKNITEMKTVDFLVNAYKLCKQQIMKISHRQQYYESEMIRALQNSKLTPQQLSQLSQSQVQQLSIRKHVLEEIYMVRQLQHVQKQFQLKYFNEREDLMIGPSGKSEEPDIKQLLSALSKNQIGDIQNELMTG